jgi:uncharacterized membrane protein
MKLLTDKQLDLTIARMLRWGVTLAAAVVFVGGVLFLLNPGATTPDYRNFRADSFPSIAGILHGAFHLNPVNLIQLGILILIATPVLRVVFCIAGFARQRDALYVTISITVLLILLYSLFQGGT